MSQLLTLAWFEDPAEIVGFILLFGAIIWALVIYATSEPNESEMLQYRIEHFKPEERDKPKEGDKPEKGDKPPVADT